MTVRFWPRSLAARTAAVVLVGLALVQIAGLTIHTLDRIDIQRLAQARESRVAGDADLPADRLDRAGAARRRSCRSSTSRRRSPSN